MKKYPCIKNLLLAFSLLLLAHLPASAQVNCTSNVPHFNVNLTGNPSGSFTTPSVTRDGNCCGTSSPDRCIHFEITLDSNAVALNFQITSGAIPPGALYYQINCGPIQQVGQYICISGVGPHHLTFCKPGNNTNTYTVTSLSKPLFPYDDTVRVGCTKTFATQGLVGSSTTWKSIYPGAPGAYNSLLSCTTGCNSTSFTPPLNSPPYIDYVVCGSPQASNCLAITQFCDTFRVYIYPPIAATVTPNPSTFCITSGGTTLTANAGGGLPPYSYIWKNPSGTVVGNTSTYFASSAGTYTCEIRDGLYPECPPTILSVPVSISDVVLNFTSTNVSCNGSGSGSASVTATGGTTPYTYNWSQGGSTASITNLSAGTYTVSVTDAGGCNKTGSVVISQPPAAVTATATSTNILCFGNNTGTASVTASGGVPPYTYQWNTGSISASLNSLVAGTYTVTVTDANSCNFTTSVQVTQPAATLSATTEVTSALCFGSGNGSAVVNASGGTGPYSYLWNNGATTTTNNNLSAGTYTVTITDANGCNIERTATVQQPAQPLNASITLNSDVSCFGESNGSASASAAGGTAPYSYLWNTGNSLPAIANMVSGSYQVTITDNNGCTATESIVIAQPASPLTATTTTTEVQCFGNSTGGSTVNATGGTAPYTYSWNTGSTSDVISNLSAGTYTVTVTDAKGCTYTRNANVLQPAQPLSTTGSVTNILCNGASTGAITYSASGGTTPYSYNWSNGNSTASLTNLTAGTYIVTVTDAHSCTVQNIYTVQQPAQPVNVNISAQQDVACFGGSNGTINLQVTGGTGSYTYQWNHGASSQNVSVAAGIYTVTVTDQNNCTAQATGIIVAQPPAPLSATSSVSAVRCNAGSDGAINVNPAGGTTPYTYMWSNGLSTQNATALSTGSYSLTITDANGCTYSLSASVSQPSSPLTSDLTTTDVNCAGNVTGSVSLTTGGGTTPYTYLWSNGSVQEDIINLTSDTYTVTITDANGCTLVSSATVSQPPGALDFTTNVTDVLCFGNSTGSIIVNASAGTPPYTYQWNTGATSSSLSSLISGTYTVTVSDANNCALTNTLFITQPAEPLQITAATTAVKCFGDASGVIDINTAGGTAGYAFQWSNGSSNEDLTNVTSGTYTITVTDFNNCRLTEQFSITQPSAPLAATGSVVNLNCHDVDDASITLNTTGGTPVYAWQWNNGSSASAISGLNEGSYNVTITDLNGCTLEQNYTIIYNAPVITSAASVVDVNCFSELTGAIDFSANGGTAPYTYQWNNGQSSQDLNSVGAGQYNVTVTDANGCTHAATFSVAEPSAALASTHIKLNENCFSDSSGVIDITPAGGTTPYTFTWSNGASSEDLNGITAGTYSVTVTDANGCTTSISETITGPSAALAFSSTVQDVDCNSNLSGSIQLAVSGGTAPYIYNWNTGDSTSAVSGIPAGTYTFSVTDINNCILGGTVVINEPPNALQAATVTTAAGCFGNATGSATVTPSGGTGPYTIIWSNGATTMLNDNLTAGNYIYTVTDAQNCNFNGNVTVNEPAAALQVQATGGDILCHGSSTGTITLSTSGGTPGYTYLWSNNATTSSIQALSAGQYNVTVTDANNCTTTATVSLTQPSAAVTATSAITANPCNSGSAGAITITPSGGVGPYNVSWNNGATGNTNTQLPAGTYTALITDNNGCTFTDNYVVAEPAQPLILQPQITAVSCNGLNNGSLSVNATGGNAGYSFQWNNGSTSSSLNNLTPGSYQVTVTDAGGCSVTATYNITQPVNMAFTATATTSACLSGQPGSVTTTISGGTQPYQYQWNTGSTSASLTNIYSGTYTVTVTDANGCTSQQTATINDQSVLNLNTNGPVEICTGTSTTLSATAIPGVTYQWSFNNVPLNGANAPSFTTPAPGVYTLTATSSCGTYTSAPVRVITRSLENVSISNSFIICPGEQAQLLAGGGVNYEWTPTNGLSNATIPNPVASPKTTTEYTVTVTDDFGCKATATVTVSVLCDTLDVPNGFSPNGDGTNDYFVIDGLSQYPENTLFIYNRWGNLIYKMNRYDNTWNGNSNVSGIYMSKSLPNGTYYYILDLGLDDKPLNGFLVLKR